MLKVKRVHQYFPIMDTCELLRSKGVFISFKESHALNRGVAMLTGNNEFWLGANYDSQNEKYDRNGYFEYVWYCGYVGSDSEPAPASVREVELYLDYVGGIRKAADLKGKFYKYAKIYYDGYICWCEIKEIKILKPIYCTARFVCILLHNMYYKLKWMNEKRKRYNEENKTSQTCMSFNRTPSVREVIKDPITKEQVKHKKGLFKKIKEIYEYGELPF